MKAEIAASINAKYHEHQISTSRVPLDILERMGALPSDIKKLKAERERSSAPKNTPSTRIRTANQRLIDARNTPPLQALFGPLWETPGIAILAGDTGVGKSILAVLIANLVTSDAKVLLGQHCEGRFKTIFYDFELTDRQFEKRFESFSFTDDFLTGDTDPTSIEGEAFSFDHICADIERYNAKVIILDNITALALKTTADADISISIMKGLKRLQVERGVSTLVLAHTPKIPSGVALDLNCLAGSKHLSNFADSVFFIGRSSQDKSLRYIKQVKNRTGEELNGVLVCELNDTSGYIGFSLVGTDEEVNHLALSTENSSRTVRKAPQEAVLGMLPTCLTQAQSAGQLEGQLAGLLDTDARTIRKRLKELVDSGAQITDHKGAIYILMKAQKGREAWYSLHPIVVSS